MSETVKSSFIPKEFSAEILSTPFCDWSAGDLLAYFQSRSGIHYFPVVDEVETERTKIDSIMLHRQFDFNHESFPLAYPPSWTQNPSQDIEWLILLHKFYYAVGLGIAFDETKDPRFTQTWQDLTLSWIETVPLDFLPSDVTGRRIQNWIFAHYYFVTLNPTTEVSPEFYRKFLRSLHQQVSYLCQHLTPARNHRTLELCAIFLAAIVFPEFSEAAQWLEMSREELVKNIETDLQPDGVHCEQSTDYHHLVLKNYLWVRRLAQLNAIPIPKTMDTRIQNALQFSLFAHKPDGFIPSISDGDSRCFLDLLEQGYQVYGGEALRYVFSKGTSGIPPNERSKGFYDSGYFILRSGWGNDGESYEDERYLLFDCGPLGAGNHGHLDLLNIEIAAYGRSLIVDPGRYTYDESSEINWRVRFRETAAHNTVVVDGKNQTRYQFHKTRHKILGPPPDYELKTFSTQPGFDFLHGIARSHEYPVTHERKIFFVSPDYWIISDLLVAEELHNYDLFFHLSDEAFERISVDRTEDALLIYAPHLVLAQPRAADIHLTIEEGYVSRTYGMKHLAPIVKFSSKIASLCFHTVVFPYKTDCPDVRVKELPVSCAGNLCEAYQASALCVTIGVNDHKVQDYYFVRHVPLPGRFTFGEFAHEGTMKFFRMNGYGKILLQSSL